MSEGLIIAILGSSGIVNVALLTLMGSIWYRLGKMNGTIQKHEKLYKACPLCPDKEK